MTFVTMMFLFSDAVMDVEKGKENLGKAEQFKKAAMKKKVIFAVVLIVLVIVILLIILSEFGAFSGDGGTTVVNHYIYKYLDFFSSLCFIENLTSTYTFIFTNLQIFFF